jgi:hypothetical protein
MVDRTKGGPAVSQITLKSQLLARIAHERGLWEQLVAEIGDAQMTLPGATGDWSFKDVVAHLNGWRINTLARLDAALQQATPTPPWPAQFDEDHHLDQINDWIYQTHRDRPLQEVLDEYHGSFQRMYNAVVALPEADLFDAGRYPWTGGRSLAQVVEDSFGHFHDEHEPTLRAWMARVRARPS